MVLTLHEERHCRRAQIEYRYSLHFSFHRWHTGKYHILHTDPTWQSSNLGVTGFGMAGRRLRERLIDSGLTGIYFRRMLPWSARTRQWPAAYTAWQGAADDAGG